MPRWMRTGRDIGGTDTCMDGRYSVCVCCSVFACLLASISVGGGGGSDSLAKQGVCSRACVRMRRVRSLTMVVLRCTALRCRCRCRCIHCLCPPAQQAGLLCLLSKNEVLAGRPARPEQHANKQASPPNADGRAWRAAGVCVQDAVALSPPTAYRVSPPRAGTVSLRLSQARGCGQ